MYIQSVRHRPLLVQVEDINEGISVRLNAKCKRSAMYVRPASLGACGVVYCGNGYACYARARCRAPRDAGRAYMAERTLAMGRADIPSFSDFQKLISR